MEAVPRLPMISFDLKVSPEHTSFGSKLKQYIADAYNENPESYAIEIRQLDSLRASAVRPLVDVSGCQTLKRYFCQLHFLQSRFPMGKGDLCAVTFHWRDVYANMVCSLADIKFEMVSILYNIGVLHTQLGAADSRTTSDGMKIACTHFQCAAWAFQHLRQNYPQPAGVDLAPEVIQYMYHLCFAQAQECILEKSMLDNRKATIIAKVAVQVVDFYNQALNALQVCGDDGSIAEIVGTKLHKEWCKYLKFKVAYHTCISLLYQGQQAEEQQKMGERVAFYHAASQELENARKLSKGLDQHSVIMEAITFTMDVVEGKKKAATNENEFIYHEEVPERDTLQLVKGAALVKGIPFNFNDPEVSGPDIFTRLVPMQAHEASSIYSEEKAQLLRRISAQVEEKEAQLVSFVSSLQLDIIEHAAQIILNGVKMTDLPQDVVDRAALLSTKPDATKRLVDVMAILANLYHDVESMLEEINNYLEEEMSREKEYQSAVGTRPPSMVATELKREAGKYSEAHSKANDSNQTLHRAMTLHITNLKLLALPLDELRKHIPTIQMPDPNINIDAIKDLSMLINKIEEMKKQRSTLITQLREAISKDDVTEHIVTKPSDQPLDALFAQEMQKHQQVVKLIEQNLVAQDNIMQAMTDAYARHSNTRKTIVDLLKHRETTIHALISSYDAYEDLLAKANKGIDFYKKLETNVSKLLQRVKSTCKVQEEEREVILAKNKPYVENPSIEAEPSTGPKLKDYLATMKRDSTGSRPGTNPGSVAGPASVPSATAGYYTAQNYPPVVSYDTNPSIAPVDVQTQVIPSIRPAPVGSEGTNETTLTDDKNNSYYMNPNQIMICPPHPGYSYQNVDPTIKNLEDRMTALMAPKSDVAPSSVGYVNSQTYVAPGTYYGVSVGNNQNQPYYSTEQQITYTSSNSNNLTYTPGSTNAYYSSASAATTNGSGVQYPTNTYNTNPQYNSMNGQYQGTLPQSYPSTTGNVDSQYQYPSTTTLASQPYQYYPQYATATPNTEAYNYNPYYYQQNYSSTVNAQPSSATINSQQAATYYGHPGYGYDTTSGQYMYSTGFQNTNNPQPAAAVTPDPSHYTSAGQYRTTQTPSEQYSAPQTPQPPTTETYYSAPYGHTAQENYNYPYPSPSVQPQSPLTYINSTKTNMSITSIGNVVTSTQEVSKKESNIDLLSDIDFNIPYAPLTPQTNTQEYIIVEKANEKPPPPPVSSSIPVVQQKIDKTEKSSIKKDPLIDQETLTQFTQEVEKFEKFVENLTSKTLNGPTPLELKWKELQELQERDAQQLNISVARCYPVKNRFPDILPYDHSRVEMPSTKDDYINASHIKNISSSSPNFIMTQAPLNTTLSDFWIMVWEQQCEIIVCLLNESELQDKYLPQERGQDLVYGRLKLSLESVNVKTHWTERTISMCLLEPKMTRVIIHLQLTSWPGVTTFPTSPGPFLTFVCEVLSFYSHQRSHDHSIVVHCDSGIGRSGLFCVLAAYITAPVPLPDIVKMVGRISKQRKQALRDREHLKFAYQAVLYHAQDLLMKRGILTTRTTFEEPIKSKTHTRHPSQDLLLGIERSQYSDGSNGRRGSNTSLLSDSSTSSTTDLTNLRSKSKLDISTANPKTNNDPLLSLDPLWSLKKE